jgi:hypothetical protein
MPGPSRPARHRQPIGGASATAEPPRNVVPPAVARQHIERLRDLLRKS